MLQAVYSEHLIILKIWWVLLLEWKWHDKVSVAPLTYPIIFRNSTSSHERDLSCVARSEKLSSIIWLTSKGLIISLTRVLKEIWTRSWETIGFSFLSWGVSADCTPQVRTLWLTPMASEASGSPAVMSTTPTPAKVGFLGKWFVVGGRYDLAWCQGSRAVVPYQKTYFTVANWHQQIC